MQPNPSNGFVNSKFMRSELQAIPTQRPVTQEKLYKEEAFAFLSLGRSAGGRRERGQIG
jgi:hypothetical protein